MEDTQSVVVQRVGHIVTELSKFLVDGASSACSRRPCRIVHQIIPEPVVFATCTVIPDQDIVRIRQPEASRGRVSIEQGEGGLCFDDKIVLDAILCFNTIFNENRVTFRVVIDVADEA